MEKALLQEMIRDREICIQFLEKRLAGQEKKAERLKKEQSEISETKQKDRQVQRSELMQLWKNYDGVLSRYQDLKDELDTRKQQQQQQQQDTSNEERPPKVGPTLDTYIEIMKGVPSGENGDGESSNYVVKMQSQLCKAMHGMGVMETQRHMTKGQTEHIQKKAKDVVTEMVEEQSNVELKMVNDLIVADNSKREVDGKKSEQHEAYSKQKNDLMEKIERQLDEAVEDDADAENDEALEEAKEELKEVLEEGRQEMERLEKLNAEAEEKIEALKIKASLAQGQDVVKDLVTSIEEEFAQEESDDEGSQDGSY